MKPTRDEKLRAVVDKMSPPQKYRLLAKLRKPDEPVTERERELIWYLLRGVVILAVVRSYKVRYQTLGRWYRTSGGEKYEKSYPIYDQEVDRIIMLAESIRDYRITRESWKRSMVRLGKENEVRKQKGEELWTEDMMMVAKALSRYHKMFFLFEFVIRMRLRGVCVDKVDGLTELDGFLRRANYNVLGALNLWRDRNTEQWQKYFDGVRKTRPPSQSDTVVIRTYLRLIRHAMVLSFAYPVYYDADDNFDEETELPWKSLANFSKGIHELLRYKKVEDEKSIPIRRHLETRRNQTLSNPVGIGLPRT